MIKRRLIVCGLIALLCAILIGVSNFDALMSLIVDEPSNAQPGTLAALTARMAPDFGYYVRHWITTVCYLCGTYLFISSIIEHYKRVRSADNPDDVPVIGFVLKLFFLTMLMLPPTIISITMTT